MLVLLRFIGFRFSLFEFSCVMMCFILGSFVLIVCLIVRFWLCEVFRLIDGCLISCISMLFLFIVGMKVLLVFR